MPQNLHTLLLLNATSCMRCWLGASTCLANGADRDMNCTAGSRSKCQDVHEKVTCQWHSVIERPGVQCWLLICCHHSNFLIMCTHVCCTNHNLQLQAVHDMPQLCLVIDTSACRGSAHLIVSRRISHIRPLGACAEVDHGDQGRHQQHSTNASLWRRWETASLYDQI